MNESLQKEVRAQKSINKELSMARANAEAERKKAETWQHTVTRMQLAMPEIQVLCASHFFTLKAQLYHLANDHSIDRCDQRYMVAGRCCQNAKTICLLTGMVSAPCSLFAQRLPHLQVNWLLQTRGLHIGPQVETRQMS